MSRPRTTRSSRWIVRTTLIALAAASSVGLQSAMSPPGAAAADPATSSAATSTTSAAPAVDASVPGDGTSQSPAVLVSKLTGPGSVSHTDTRWKITGTDLGIAWDNGADGILTLYGDTFGDWSGPGGGGGDWRSNVLVRSTDTDLTDGVTYSSAPEDRPGHAKELIPSAKVDNVEMTTIPTAATYAGNGRQLMAYMSVRHWGPPGLWDTNFNQFAWSDDDGENWSTEGAPRWANTAAGDHPFQMVAFAQRGGYLYMWGTPNGRVGAGHVARVPQASWADKGAWRYWDGKRWGASDLAAAPVVPAPVSELSVAWNDHTRSFVMMYLLGGDIVLRHSTAPQGPWSEPQVLASFADYPALYGGYIDPRSSGSDLYFSMSQWNPYNSYLMRVSLDRDANVVNPNLVHDSGWERQTGSGTSAPWVCTGQCGTDANQAIAAAGDHNGWVRNNRGWNSLHQDVRVKANTDYVFTGWIRTSENNDNGYIGVRTPQLQVIGEHNFRAVGEWTRVQIPFNSGDRTSVQTFAGIWTDNGDMWLQTDSFSIVEAAGATPPPDGVAANVSATSQCNRKSAQLQVRVTNDAGIPVAVTVETALGTKSKAKLARGATYAVAFQAAPDRRRLASGTVTVTVSGQRDGQPVSQTYTVAYRAVTC